MNETKEWNLCAAWPLLHGTEENPVTVIVVSNRVARAKSDEPVAGGLAAALIPMVKDSGAIWVGSSGQTSDKMMSEMISGPGSVTSSSPSNSRLGFKLPQP